MSIMTLNKEKMSMTVVLLRWFFFWVNYNASNIASMHILNGVEK